jgi:hypothetical protein
LQRLCNNSPALPAPNREQKTPSLSDIGILKIFNYFKKQLKLVFAADCYLCGGDVQKWHMDAATGSD